METNLLGVNPFMETNTTMLLDINQAKPLKNYIKKYERALQTQKDLELYPKTFVRTFKYINYVYHTKGRCTVSQTTLAQNAGYTREWTNKRIIPYLEEERFIRAESRGKFSPTRQRTLEYVPTREYLTPEALKILCATIFLLSNKPSSPSTYPQEFTVINNEYINNSKVDTSIQVLTLEKEAAPLIHDPPPRNYSEMEKKMLERQQAARTKYFQAKKEYEDAQTKQ